jgi:rod shape-determining protein MreC
MMLSSANAITGRILSVSNNIISYFNLQKTNQELLERTNELEMEVVRLREHLNNLTTDNTQFSKMFLSDSTSTDKLKSGDNKYKFITAGVVNNSIIYQNNYITINKGTKDGIFSDMGVVSPKGVVGIVTTVNDRFAVVMSLLHTKSRVSCKVLHTNFFGSLSWKVGDVRYGYLEHIPTHAVFQVGDTIVTSGLSDVFPSGMMVGVVESFDKQNDNNFYSLKVHFAADFQSLSALCVIDNQLQAIQNEIEKEARKND